MPVNTEFRGIEYFENTFKEQIGNDGEIKDREFVFQTTFGEKENQAPIEADRYRIVWMPGCPHAHKVVITWKLLGLDQVISLGTTGILRTPTGWVFSEDPEEKDPVLKVHSLHELYLNTDPDFTGRSTVPAIVDITTGKVVNNKHYDIPIYLNTAWKPFHKEHAPVLYPENLRDDIDKLNAYVFRRVNEGFYKAGFARSQEQYERGYNRLFEALDFLDEHLKHRRFLFGDYITDTDIRLYPSLVRYYFAYHQVFRTNKKRLNDYKNLWPYARDIYQTPGIQETTFFDLIKKHYQISPHLRPLWGNVYGIYAKGPEESPWFEPSEREHLSGHPGEKFLVEV